MGRLFLRFFVGAAAGIIVWMICEPAAPKTVSAPTEAQWELTFILFLGGAIGLAVGGLDGYLRGGKVHTIRGALLGLLFGMVGCPAGAALGGGLAALLFGPGWELSSNLAVAMPARIMSLTFVGAFVGLAIGASSLNFKKMVQGLIGGSLGGALAGAVFDPLGQGLGQAILAARGQTSGEVGTPGRAVFAVVLGAAIGLFIGLVERWARSAWLRLSLGRNEGREWSIDRDRVFIGRSESADVPLFGDPNVAQLHAYVQRQGPNFILVDGGSPMGTYINGQRIQQAPLVHGAQIQVGSFILQFLMKNQAAPVPMYDMAGARAGYPMGGAATPMPGGAVPGGGMPVPQPQGLAPAAAAPYGGPAGFAPAQPMPTGGMMQQTQAYAAPAANPTVAYGGGMPGGYSIIAIDGPMVGRRFPIGGPTELGREASGVRMDQDPNASRRHAAVSPGLGGIAVQDLGSTNGTFVNGQRVSQATAGPGDLIKVGSTTFRVEAA